MTLAARYNAQAKRLMPHMADDLAVDPAIDNAGHIEGRVEGQRIVILTEFVRKK